MGEFFYFLFFMIVLLDWSNFFFFFFRPKLAFGDALMRRRSYFIFISPSNSNEYANDAQLMADCYSLINANIEAFKKISLHAGLGMCAESLLFIRFKQVLNNHEKYLGGGRGVE